MVPACPFVLLARGAAVFAVTMVAFKLFVVRLALARMTGFGLEMLRLAFAFRWC